jgi:hypothetical protein
MTKTLNYNLIDYHVTVSCALITSKKVDIGKSEVPVHALQTFALITNRFWLSSVFRNVARVKREHSAFLLRGEPSRSGRAIY